MQQRKIDYRSIFLFIQTGWLSDSQIDSGSFDVNSETLDILVQNNFWLSQLKLDKDQVFLVPMNS